VNATTGAFSGNVTFSDKLVSTSVTTDTTRGIMWNNSGDFNYSITRTSGAWTSPNFQQLQIKWNTGMILDVGNGTYGRSYVGVNDRMAIGSSYYNSNTKPPDNGLLVEGYVGIGTTNPGAALDVNGYMKNNNPCFYARRNATQGTGVYIFNIEELDSHNAYNPANGRFTAPNAGRYVFNVWAMSNGNTLLYLEFRKNGVRVYNASPYTSPVGNHANVAGTIVINLAVNDYVDINVMGGAAYGGGNDHNGFCGYMIG
jgi:hypothetical protein